MGDLGVFDAINPLGFVKEWAMDTVIGALPAKLGTLATGFLQAFGMGSLFLSGMQLISALPRILQGSAHDSAKTGKFINAMESATPEERMTLVNNIINGNQWRGEDSTNNQYVTRPLLENGVLNEYYPAFWADNSKYDLWSGEFTTGTSYTSQGIPSLGLDYETQANLQYGWDVANDDEWKNLVQPINVNNPAPWRRYGSTETGEIARGVFQNAGILTSSREEYWPTGDGDPFEPRPVIPQNMLDSMLGAKPNTRIWISGFGNTLGGHYTEEQIALGESLGMVYTPPKPNTDRSGDNDNSSPERWDWPLMDEFIESGGRLGASPDLVRGLEAIGATDLANVARYQLEATGGGGDIGKFNHFSDVYTQLKDSGYTGDLSRLEAHLSANDPVQQARRELEALEAEQEEARATAPVAPVTYVPQAYDDTGDALQRQNESIAANGGAITLTQGEITYLMNNPYMVDMLYGSTPATLDYVKRTYGL